MQVVSVAREEGALDLVHLGDRRREVFRFHHESLEGAREIDGVQAAADVGPDVEDLEMRGGRS